MCVPPAGTIIIDSDEAMAFPCELLMSSRFKLCVPPIIDSDAASSLCEHIMSLKLCLGDTIHAFYIKALAIMPLRIQLTRFTLFLWLDIVTDTLTL